MTVTVSDSEILTMAIMSALLGYRSERRWLRYASSHLGRLFPRQPGQSGYSKRLRKMSFLLMTAIRRLAMDTSLWSDDVFEGTSETQRMIIGRAVTGLDVR